MWPRPRGRTNLWRIAPSWLKSWKHATQWRSSCKFTPERIGGSSLVLAKRLPFSCVARSRAHGHRDVCCSGGRPQASQLSMCPRPYWRTNNNQYKKYQVSNGYLDNALSPAGFILAEILGARHTHVGEIVSKAGRDGRYVAPIDKSRGAGALGPTCTFEEEPV